MTSDTTYLLEYQVPRSSVWREIGRFPIEKEATAFLEMCEDEDEGMGVVFRYRLSMVTVLLEGIRAKV